MNKKIQIALTDAKTGQTSITGMELGEIGFGLKLETIFKVDKIEVFELKTNSQVCVSGRGLDNNERAFPCEISYIFFPDEGFEKQQTLKRCVSSKLSPFPQNPLMTSDGLIRAHSRP